MNSKLLQASRKIWLGLATLVTLTAAGTAQNNINGPAVNNNSAVIVDRASASLFRPRGIIKAMVPNPAAPGGVSWNWWVSDGASGFCRVIPDATGLLQRDLNNCDLPGVSEPMDYQAETFGVNGSNGYVFVAGITSIERVQFTVDPANPAWTIIKDEVAGVPGSRVFIYNGSIKNPGPLSIFANGLPAAGNRNIESARLGPDGKLYFIMQGSGDIWRVRNPLTPTMSPQSNIIERVGTSDNGKTLLSIAWVGHDLWMQQAGFLNKLANADKCNYTADCVALLEIGTLQTQEGMQTDQFNSKVADGRYLYWFNGNRVILYDTLSAADLRVYAHQGYIVDQGTNLGHVGAAAFTLGFAVNWVQPSLPAFPPTGNAALDAMRPIKTITDLHGISYKIADMTFCMDETLEAPPIGVAGNLPRTGRCYDLPPAPTPVIVRGAAQIAGVRTTDECQPSGILPVPPPGAQLNKLTPAQVIEQITCVITSSIGNDPNISPSQQAAARRAVLLVSGVTHPRGLVFLKTNYWVSDEQLGFCKISINPADGSGSLTSCFTFVEPAAAIPGGNNGIGTFLPGQAALDPTPNANGTLNVYVPDASAPGRGLVRLLFIPDATGGTVSQTGALQAGPHTAYAAAMPNSAGAANDHSVYIGYSDLATINKIKTPLTAPSAPVAVGSASGIGVLSMAFRGSDLFLGELAPQVNTNGQLAIGGQVTQLVAASPDLQRGGAVVVKKALSRLQSPNVPTPQLFVNPGAIAIGPALDREKCLPPVGVALSPSIGDPLTTPALYLGSMGSNPNDSGTLTLPEVDQFGANCTTQIPWVEQASLDALHTINVQLSAVTALAFSDASSTASMAIGDDPSTLPLDNLSAQKSGFKPPTTTAIGQGHVYIVP